MPDLAAFVAVGAPAPRLADGRRGACAGRARAARLRLGRPCRRRPRRGRHLDGHAEQDAGVLRRLYRRPQGAGRLPEAHGAGLCVLGRHGAAGRRRRAGRGRNPASASRSGCAGSTSAPRCSCDLAREGGLDVGGSIGAAIVPVITGSSIRAGRLAQALFARGINVQPILYPAVPERAARLRFFLTAEHSEEQVREAAAIVIEEHRAVAAEPTDLAAVARHLGRRLPGRTGIARSLACGLGRHTYARSRPLYDRHRLSRPAVPRHAAGARRASGSASIVKEPEVWAENKRLQSEQEGEVKLPLFTIFKRKYLLQHASPVACGWRHFLRLLRDLGAVLDLSAEELLPLHVQRRCSGQPVVFPPLCSSPCAPRYCSAFSHPHHPDTSLTHDPLSPPHGFTAASGLAATSAIKRSTIAKCASQRGGSPMGQPRELRARGAANAGAA